MYHHKQLWETIEEQVALREHINNIGNEDTTMALKACKCDVWSGVDDLVSVQVSEQVHLAKMSIQVRNAVKVGLRTGLMKSRGGKGAFIYKLLCEQHGIPMCIINGGDVNISSKYSTDTTRRILAMHVISGGTKPADGYGSVPLSLYQSKLTHQQIQDVVAEEYAQFNEHICAALTNIRDDATLHYETTIKR